MAVQPSILLLDEPTAGLSSHETAEVDRLLRRLVEEWRIGVLLVEHDVGLVMSVCDDVVVLNFGEVISTAPPNEARRDPAVIAAYLGEDSWTRSRRKRVSRRASRQSVELIPRTVAEV
jgi:ABC-type branched-subunit amino acid transport system ATPase component